MSVKRHPIIRKGAAAPFSVSMTCWIDLLGYGATISAADFNPMHPKSQAALQRLRRFHRIVAEHSHDRYPTLTINDGAVAYRDLSWRSKSVTFNFLCRSWELFQSIETAEQSTGDAGVRLVLASGFRVRGSARSKVAAADRMRSIITRLQTKKISAEQAIREASTHRHCSDVVPALQANFSFTKAYLAESGGAKVGLLGPYFYADLAVFSRAEPDWIDLGSPIQWRNDRLGLEARFAKVHSINWTGKGGRTAPQDIRDAFELAQFLAPNNDVLSALQTYRRSHSSHS